MLRRAGPYGGVASPIEERANAAFGGGQAVASIVAIADPDEISESKVVKVLEFYKLVYAFHDCDIAQQECEELIKLLDSWIDMKRITERGRFLQLVRSIAAKRPMEGEELRRQVIQRYGNDQAKADLGTEIAVAAQRARALAEQRLALADRAEAAFG